MPTSQASVRMRWTRGCCTSTPRFLLDPWWNPTVEDQAADRAHRLGQTRPVLVYRLVAQDTVEERILALQERKRAMAGAALAGADRGMAITREELLALLT